MPLPPDPVFDERFEEIVAQLEAAKPAASAELRERVGQAARFEPARRRPLSRRLLVPALAAVLLGLVVAAAVFAPAGGDGGAEEEAAAPRAGEAELRGVGEPDSEAAEEQPQRGAVQAQPQPSRGIPPSGTRPQNYRAELRVHVRDIAALSRATERASRIARSLSGFVVTARYDAPAGREGDSFLVVRVPVTRVQEAIRRFSELGEIVAQRFSLEDVQRSLNEQNERIRALRTRVAELERELREPGLSDAERVVLRQRLEAARDELARLVERRNDVVAQTRLARVALTLTTREPGEAPPEPPGDLEQTLRDAVSVLATVTVWLVAVLIVASPFLVLFVGGALLARRYRRRADERLLERSSS